jgi:transcriptional regulator GlxA family with amidase domain
MDARVEKVILGMQTDLRQEISVSERAEAVNLTASHLCRLFKAETGVSPNKYLKLLRIQKATQLLDTTFLNVKEIMIKVGMKDESHFVRDFELICGSSPARYRNGRQRQKHELDTVKIRQE